MPTFIPKCSPFLVPALCFTTSLLVATALGSLPSAAAQPHPNDTNINILYLEIRNDLPPTAGSLDFTGNWDPSLLHIDKGDKFSILTNFHPKYCVLYLDHTNCAEFYVYDPVRDAGHQKVFWSVRADGVYHSWDAGNGSWQKLALWKGRYDCHPQY